MSSTRKAPAGQGGGASFRAEVKPPLTRVSGCAFPVNHLDDLPAEAVFQAEKFLQFTAKGGDPDRWWRSKDFTASQRRAIQRAIAVLRRGSL